MRHLAISLALGLACASAKGQASNEQQANEAKLRQLQHEIAIARVQAQTESIRNQTELLRLQMERRADERANQPREKNLTEIMGEIREEKAAEEATVQAEAEREDQVAIAVAKSADTVYLSFGLALPVAFAFLIARRAKATGKTMKHEEKFGVILMIAALILGLLALTISENWVPRLDAMQNLMLTLKIKLFPESELIYSSAMIDVYTKHVLLGLVILAAYGFTTYLGITPAWKTGAATSVTPSELPELPKEPDPS